jgi:hypothetical protein
MLQCDICSSDKALTITYNGLSNQSLFIKFHSVLLICQTHFVLICNVAVKFKRNYMFKENYSNRYLLHSLTVMNMAEVEFCL